MQLGLILDIQHAGKPSRPTDLGASADLDGDGVIERDEHEARLTPLYAAACRDLASEAGAPVLWLDGGEYSSRHRAANEIAKSQPGRRWLYVACHLNAGGGDYGLVVADGRSKAGRAAAEDVAAQLRSQLSPELRRALAGTTAAEGSDWPRAYGTIAGVWDGPGNIAGICFEPAFIDTERHRPLLTPEGMKRIGRALFEGARAWAASP